MSWAEAFAVTQLCEVPIYALALRPRPVTRRLLIGFGASALTHPVVWFVFPVLVHGYWLMVACAEAFAVLAEAAYLDRFRVPHPLAWSLLANATSVAVGLTMRALLHFP